MEAITDPLALKFALVFPHLDERQRRIMAAVEARALGRGGVTAVAKATGMSRSTVTSAVKELKEGLFVTDRVRRPGGGAKSITERFPGLVPALKALVERETRGDPESALVWTTKSTRNLAEELTAQGHPVSHETVSHLLRGLGFSLQANAKTREGSTHADRDAQFRYINKAVAEHQASGDPVISVDCKKKELVGNFKNGGREWQPSGQPDEVNVDDFPALAEGKAIPYGVYDVVTNEGRGDHPPVARHHGQARVPRGRPAAHLCGWGRLQRLAQSTVEDRAGGPVRRERPGDHRVPPATGHLQVEPHRAPALLPYLDELAGSTSRQL